MRQCELKCYPTVHLKARLGEYCHQLNACMPIYIYIYVCEYCHQLNACMPIYIYIYIWVQAYSIVWRMYSSPRALS